MKRFLLVLLPVFLIGLAGCRTFSGDISFRNRSANEIWVDDTEGFKMRVPCGILGPGIYKGARMGLMPLPDEVTLAWSYDLHRSDRSSVVTLKGLEPPASDAELQFVFTEENVWTVRWRNPNEPL